MNGHGKDGMSEALVWARANIENEIIHALRDLSVPIDIVPGNDDTYYWSTVEGQGIAQSLASALTQAISFLVGRVSSASNIERLRKEQQQRIDEGETT